MLVFQFPKVEKPRGLKTKFGCELLRLSLEFLNVLPIGWNDNNDNTIIVNEKEKETAEEELKKSNNNNTEREQVTMIIIAQMFLQHSRLKVIARMR